jgi:hypothetical protein
LYSIPPVTKFGTPTLTPIENLFTLFKSSLEPFSVASYSITSDESVLDTAEVLTSVALCEKDNWRAIKVKVINREFFIFFIEDIVFFNDLLKKLEENDKEITKLFLKPILII